MFQICCICRLLPPNQHPAITFSALDTLEFPVIINGELSHSGEILSTRTKKKMGDQDLPIHITYLNVDLSNDNGTGSQRWSSQRMDEPNRDHRNDCRVRIRSRDTPQRKGTIVTQMSRWCDVFPRKEDEDGTTLNKKRHAGRIPQNHREGPHRKATCRELGEGCPAKLLPPDSSRKILP